MEIVLLHRSSMFGADVLAFDGIASPDHLHVHHQIVCVPVLIPPMYSGFDNSSILPMAKLLHNDLALY
jgi:hypothetical protein